MLGVLHGLPIDNIILHKIPDAEGVQQELAKLQPTWDIEI